MRRIRISRENREEIKKNTEAAKVVRELKKPQEIRKRAKQKGREEIETKRRIKKKSNQNEEES